MITLGVFHQTLTWKLLDAAWFTDGVSDAESDLIDDLGEIAQRDEDSAVQILEMPFLTSLELPDLAAVESLTRMAKSAPSELDRILSHRLLTDGVTDDMAPVMATLHGFANDNPALVNTLLNPGNALLERREAKLRWSGEVEFVIIRTAPGSDRSMDVLVNATRDAELRIGQALPTRHIALFFEEVVPSGFVGVNRDTYIAVLPEYDVDIDSRKGIEGAHVISHLVASYYWQGNREWLDQGLSSMMASAIEFKRAGRVIGVTSQPCIHASTIADLESLDPGPDADGFDCNRSLGERLFVSIYQAIRTEAFWEGIARLYARSQADDADDDQTDRPLGVADLRNAFQSDAVDAVIDLWYSGSGLYRQPALDSGAIDPALPSIHGRIDNATLTAGLGGPPLSRFSISSQGEIVGLNLEYSHQWTGQPQDFEVDDLQIEVAEYFEDGFEFRRDEHTIPARPRSAGGTLWIPLGPRPWVPGEYWAFVFADGRRVAEIHYYAGE